MEVLLLSVVGGLFLAFYGLRFLLQVFNGVRTFILPSYGFRSDLKSFGSWSVITGCTDGIGKSYAKQLAARGLNVVLISRSREKLKAVEAEIKSEYRVDTMIIVKDFSGNADIYSDLEEKLSELDIGILVNNVGVAPTYLDDFLKSDIEEWWKMINVNALSVVMMTHIILPGMVSRGKGVVINVASLAGCDPMPLLTVYSCTKAFVDFFSRCIHAEYSSKGIFVQCVMPGFVATKMTGIKNTSSTVPSPDAYVKQALGTIGVEQRTCGYSAHALWAWIASNLIPAWIRHKMYWRFLDNVRKMEQKMRRMAKERAKGGHDD